MTLKINVIVCSLVLASLRSIATKLLKNEIYRSKIAGETIYKDFFMYFRNPNELSYNLFLVGLFMNIRTMIFIKEIQLLLHNQRRSIVVLMMNV